MRKGIFTHITKFFQHISLEQVKSNILHFFHKFSNSFSIFQCFNVSIFQFSRHFHRAHHHLKKHHKKYLFGIFGSFAVVKMIILFVGFFSIFIHMGSFASGGADCGGRDNSQFITQSFRDSSPNNAKIICALLGDGSGGTNRTAYTQNRLRVTCVTGSMAVTGIAPGTNTLPATLANNTIYVLSSGAYTITAARSPGNCSVIIGTGTVTITDNDTTNNRLIVARQKNNVILDNLRLDRNRGTNTGTTTDVVYAGVTSGVTLNNIRAYNGYNGLAYSTNKDYLSVNNSKFYNNVLYGINVYLGSTGIINNSQTYNNSGVGIYINNTPRMIITGVQSYSNTGRGIYVNSTSPYVTINNSQVYSNTTNGITIEQSSSGTINNCQVYSNAGRGIYFNASLYGTVNNSQSYGNTVYGITFEGTSTFGTINNSQVYNTTSYAIYFAGSSQCVINNSQAYNNTTHAILFNTSSHSGQVNNSQSYNNGGNGIYFNASNYGQVNNSQSYNNTGYGLCYATISSYGVVNNSQFYNNTSYGVLYTNTSSSGVINNSQIYNNGNHGVYYASGINNIINNSQSYNNASNGIAIAAVATNNTYYGTIKMFGNANAGIGTTPANFVTGTDGLVGRSNGTIDTTPTVSWDYITHPRNSAGVDMLFRTGTMVSLRGKKYPMTFDTGMQYSYGSGTYLQSQPVVYTGTTLTNGGAFTGTSFVGGSITKITGDLLGINTYNAVYSTVTGTASSLATKYNIYGNIATIISGASISTATGIQLTTGSATNTIITQLFDPTSYFAMHFQKTTTVDTVAPTAPTIISPTNGLPSATGDMTLLRSGATDTGVGIGGYIYQLATNAGFTIFTTSGTTATTGISLTGLGEGVYYRRVAAYDAGQNTGARSTTGSFSMNPCGTWDKSQFLTGGFRDANPNNNKIICALFGEGSNGTGKSAYTQNRPSTTCDITSMTVTGISPGTNTLPATLTANTIYVLSSGDYVVTGARNVASCTAIVGTGTVTITDTDATNDKMITSSSKSSIIFDNLKLNRNDKSGGNRNVILLGATTGATINNIEAYSGNMGLYTYSTSPYVTVNNSKFYNNTARGILISDNSFSGRVNNSQIYNNGGYGIWIEASANAIIDNCIVMGHTIYPIYFKVATGGIVTNSQIYDNNNTSYSTIYFLNTISGQVNNSQVYNNSGMGPYFNASNGGQVNGSQIYNNTTIGIAFGAATYGQINNSHIYNNGSYAVYFVSSSNYSVINNSQIYNNANYGVFYDTSSSSGVINNSQVYNNASYGIYYASGINNIINNSQSYNNNSYGIYVNAAATNNKYYGAIKVFSNANEGIGGTTANFVTGSDGLVGRSNGTIDTTPTMSWDYVTNPRNISGLDLLSWTGLLAGYQGMVTTFVATSGMQYSYGSGTILQSQPVLYSGEILITGGVYTGTMYIGSSLSQVTGDLLGWSSYNGIGISVTGTSVSPITKYNIYGDIVTVISGASINTITGIEFTAGTTKTVITQLYDPTNYFAMHFQKTATLDTTGPTTPDLLSPASGTVSDTSTITLLRSGSTDGGAGLSGYIYQVSTDPSFSSFAYSGTTSPSVGQGTSTTGETAATSPGTVANDATVGTEEWYNTENATGSDNFYSQAGGGGGTYYSNYLKATNFNFTIPSGAIINGIKAEIEKQTSSYQGGAFDSEIKIIKSDGTIGTTNRADTVTIWPPSDSYVTHGGISDLWGETWTSTNINDSDFGIAISSYHNGFNPYSYVDHIRMTIYYTTTTAGVMGGGTGISLTGVTDGTYYRRVAAYDSVGNTGSRSSGWNVRVDATAPTTPILLSPTSGTISDTGTINFLRSGSTDTGGMSGYIRQISTGANFANIYSSGSTTTTGKTITGLTNNTYYRRVYAFDNVGNTGSRSSVRNVMMESCVGVTEIPETECRVLKNLYNVTNGSGWNNTGRWLDTSAICNNNNTGWYGVNCFDNHVSQLNLYNNHLVGTLPNLSGLAQLKILDVISNSGFTINLSTIVDNCALTGLLLADRSTNSNQPIAQGNLTDLACMTGLVSIELPTASAVSGDISIFADMHNLGELYMNSATNIYGDISVFDQTPHLGYIQMMSTDISGDISVFVHTPDLLDIRINTTHVYGDIGVFSHANTPHLGGLSMSVMPLITGNISVFSNLTGIGYIYLNDTNVTGNLSSLSSLTSLNFGFMFQGTNVGGDISSLSGLKQITHYIMLDGPNIYGNLSALSGFNKLRYLQIYNSRIEGTLDTLLSMTGVIDIDLSNNYLTGDIPIAMMTILPNTVGSINLNFLDTSSVTDPDFIDYLDTNFPGWTLQKTRSYLSLSGASTTQTSLSGIADSFDLTYINDGTGISNVGIFIAPIAGIVFTGYSSSTFHFGADYGVTGDPCYDEFMSNTSSGIYWQSMDESLAGMGGLVGFISDISSMLGLDPSVDYTGGAHETEGQRLENFCAFMGVPGLQTCLPGFGASLGLNRNFTHMANFSCGTGGTVGYLYALNDVPANSTGIQEIGFTPTSDGSYTLDFEIFALDGVERTPADNIFSLSLTVADTIAPTIPILLSPASGTISNTGIIILTRSGSTDVGAGLSGYRYQVSSNSGFTSIIISGSKTTTGVSLTFSSDGTYYRRVYAFDTIGNTGSRSSGRTLSVDTTGPTTPDLLSPTSGTITSTGTINLVRSGSTDTIAGLSGYIYQVSTDPSFSSFAYSGTTSPSVGQGTSTTGETAATSPGTVVDDASVGTVAWSNPDNAKINDSNSADTSLGNLTVSHYLKATNFGFSIPTGATIDGILAEVEGYTYSSRGIYVSDSTISIVKSNNTIGTENKATSSHWPNPDDFPDQYSSYGSSSDLWSDSWVATDINDSDFGVVVSSMGFVPDLGSAESKVDHIRITVYYSTTTAGPMGGGTGITLTGVTDGTYYRRVAAYDSAGNTGSRSSDWNVSVDTTAPTVSTGYISSGTTGANGGSLYYNGTINVRADLSDAIGLSGATCQYTTGTSRAIATYNTTYCEVTGLTPAANINVRFRISDLAGNTTTGATGAYVYDATAPSGGSFKINNDASYASSTGVTLTTTCAVDAGISGTQVAYGNTASPTNRESCSASISHTLTVSDATKTVYMRFKDSFGNTTSDITDTIVLDTTAPVITFTGSNPTDNKRITTNGFTGKLDFVETNLNQFKRSRNGTDYSIYDSGLLLMMNFDNVSALGESLTGVTDLSQYGNNGVAYGGVVWTGNGRRNGAYDFDGYGDFIKVIDSGALDNTANITVAGWVNVPSLTPSNYKTLMVNKWNGLGYAGTNEWALTFGQTSNTIPQFLIEVGSTAYSVVGVSAISSGQRHHIVGIKNAGLLELYVDGTLVKTGSCPTSGINNVAGRDLYIGTFYSNGNGLASQSMTGLIDEVRIYNRALTSGEVSVLYNSNLNKYDTDKWNFSILQTGFADGTYRYTGYVSDLAGNTSATTGRTINKDATLPPTPTLISPTSGTFSNTGIVDLLRSGVTDAGAGLSGYRYQVSSDAGFTSILLSGSKTTTGVSLTFSSDGTYYRRVYTYDIAGNTGGRSDVSSFTIDTQVLILLDTLYDSTDGDHRTNNSGRNTLGGICNRYGIVCSGNFISEINLINNNLSGDAIVSGFSHLTTLNLSQNALTGISLSTIPNITQLNLSYNRLRDASILTTIGTLTSITGLWINDNYFYGTSITALIGLTNLVWGNAKNNCFVPEDKQYKDVREYEFGVDLFSPPIYYTSNDMNRLKNKLNDRNVTNKICSVQMSLQSDVSAIYSGDEIHYTISYYNPMDIAQEDVSITGTVDQGELTASSLSPTSTSITKYTVLGDPCFDGLAQNTGTYREGFNMMTTDMGYAGVSGFVHEGGVTDPNRIIFNAPPYNNQESLLGEYTKQAFRGFLPSIRIWFYMAMGFEESFQTYFPTCGVVKNQYIRDIGTVGPQTGGTITFTIKNNGGPYIQNASQTLLTATGSQTFTLPDMYPQLYGPAKITLTNTSPTATAKVWLKKTGAPDTRDATRLLSGVIVGGMTAKEKAEAIFHLGMQVFAGNQGTWYPGFKWAGRPTIIGTADDFYPIKFINTLYGVCGDMNNNFLNLGRIVGLTGRSVQLNSHMIIEFQVNDTGDERGMFDIDGGVYYTGASNHIYSVDELAANSGIINNDPQVSYYGKGNDNGGNNFANVITQGHTTDNFTSLFGGYYGDDISMDINLYPGDELIYAQSFLTTRINWHLIIDHYGDIFEGKGTLIRNLTTHHDISNQTTTGFTYQEIFPYLVNNIQILPTTSISDDVRVSIQKTGDSTWTTIGNLKNGAWYELNPYTRAENVYEYTLKFSCDTCTIANILPHIAIQNYFRYNARLIPITGDVDIDIETADSNFAGIQITATTGVDKGDVGVLATISSSLPYSEKTQKASIYLTLPGSPVELGTGYISNGTTGTNGGTTYYKGTIDIRANLSGTNVSSCEYTTGSVWVIANTGADYCEATGLIFTNDITIQFRATNPWGTMTGGSSSYVYDASGPSIPQLLSPTSGTSLNTGTITLLRSGAIDTGVGVAGYLYQVSTGASFSTVLRSGSLSTTGISLTGFVEGLYYRRVTAYDSISNTGIRDSGWNFVIDATPPVVTTGYISSGATGTNGGDVYYIGTINIRATVSDAVGLSGATCQYTTGSSRATAVYQTTYCEVTGLSYTADINVRFRISDLAGNITTGATGTYLYDNIAPIITGITLIPTLNASYFNDYTLAATLSGIHIISGTATLQGINGDGGNCIHYYASGSCVPVTTTDTLTLSGNQVRQATGIRPDAIYPQIFFAPASITRNNTPNNYSIYKNAYALFHMQNKFSMTGNASFWIEINALRKASNSVNMSVYVVEKGHDISYFNSNRLSRTGVELVGSITNTQTVNHTHTANSSHFLIALATNTGGTIGTKNLSISGDFWIVLYPNNTNTSRGWNLRYQPSTLCNNTSGRYIGNGSTRATASQAGCPDAHIHIARKSGTVDGVNVVVNTTYTGIASLGAIVTSGFNNFYFGALPNMSPNPTSFVSPTSGEFYSGNIDVVWNPATDPNGDTLTYNLYALSSTGLVVQRLVTGTADTGYTINQGVLTDGEYGLEIVACDTGGLCSTGYLDDNFFVDLIAPTVSTGYIFSGTTGSNGLNLYYKGTVDIRATVSDGGGLSGATCQYRISPIYAWADATYQGNYCEAVGIVSTGTIIPQFRIADSAGNMGTGPYDLSMKHSYDDAGPTFTFIDTSGSECSAGTLSMSSIADGGVGLHSSPYSFDGSTWNSTTDISITAQQPGTQVRTGWVRDKFENTTIHTATYTFTDVPPTANNFTGSENVGSGSQTSNWRTLSSASEGLCSNGDLIYSGIVSQGTKGTCSVVGDSIIYTPNTSQVGEDSCTIQIKDNENSTKDIIVYRGNIDTTAPSVPTLLSPTSGTMSMTGHISLLRSEATDVGLGISGYIYQVSRNVGFTDVVMVGDKTTTGVSLQGFAGGTYYRRVYAVDNAGNTGSRSSVRNIEMESCVGVTEISETECRALKHFYDVTGGPQRANTGNYRGDTSSICNYRWSVNDTGWYGVYCENNHVTALNFQIGVVGNNLQGELPADTFSGLTYLEAIFMPSNHFSGTLPQGIFNRLPNLYTISLLGNDFSGELPTNLFSGLDSVGQIYFGSNNFYGAFPSITEIGPHLQTLMLHDANFSGTLDWLCDATNLSGITIRNNNFYGDIPECLTGITTLTPMNIGGSYRSIENNYLNVDNVSPELSGFLRAHMGTGWDQQRRISDLTVSSTDAILSGDNLVFTISAINTGPNNIIDAKIFLQEYPGLSVLTADVSYTHTKQYFSLIDSCYIDLIENDTGAYRDAVEDNPNAGNGDLVATLATFGYPGGRSGAGARLISLLSSMQMTLSSMLETWGIDVTTLTGCGASGYFFQVPRINANVTGLIDVVMQATTGFLDANTGTTLDLYINSTYALRSDVDMDNNVGTLFIPDTTKKFTYESPTSLDMGTLATPETTQVIERIFTGTDERFIVADYRGDDIGYYTTLSMSNMGDENGNTLSNNNIAIKTVDDIVTLSGSANPNVVSAITGYYRTFGSSVITFIKRDAGPNGWKTGVYGASPALEITIPELQGMGDYSGTMIYTLYPN